MKKTASSINWSKIQKLDKRGYKVSFEEPENIKKQIAIIKEVFPGAKVVARKDI